jgi:hypothetical protein
MAYVERDWEKIETSAGLRDLLEREDEFLMRQLFGKMSDHLCQYILRKHKSPKVSLLHDLCERKKIVERLFELECKEIAEVSTKVKVLGGTFDPKTEFDRIRKIAKAHPFDREKAESVRAEILEEEPEQSMEEIKPEVFTLEMVVVRSDVDAKFT